MVKVYTTESCPFCVTLKDFLKNNNIEFESFNVAEDLEARKEMIEKSGQMGVPVMDIDGQIVIGFDKRKIVELLGIKEEK